MCPSVCFFCYYVRSPLPAPVNVRSEFVATVLPLQVGRFARPCAHSTYAYTSSERSPAQLASTCFGPLGCGPDSDRAWHLGYWEALLGPRRSLREKPSPLPAPSRRYAAQFFVGRIQPPRLASCPAAHPPNRGSAFSLRSRLVPRPASRTTLAVAFLSLIPAAPLSQRLSPGQPNTASNIEL